MPPSRPVRWLRLLGRDRHTLDLPGLLSASEFERLFLREKALADRQARTFSLVVIDPRQDHEHLQRLCEVLRDRMRSGDAVGRLDSQRLAVLLSGTDAKGAWTYADDLLRRLAEAEVSADCRVYADLPYQFQGQGKQFPPASNGPGPATSQAATSQTNGSGVAARAPAAGEGLEAQHPGQKRLEFPGEQDSAEATEASPAKVPTSVERELGTGQRALRPSPDAEGDLALVGHPFQGQPQRFESGSFAEGNTLRRLEREPTAEAGNLMAFPERLSEIAAIRRDLGERPVHNLEDFLVTPMPGWKRAMDIACSGFALVLLSPLLLALAGLVRLSSPGPIIFRQQRIGAGGRPFTFFKFRSMYVDAEARKAELMAKNEADGPVFKIKDDPRVTPIGRILRRYSLDELPQLWNVLKGDMSLVGPRPPTPDEVPSYQAWQRQRLRLKGGLTCTWQVSGRSDVSFEQWMRMDARYAKQRGFKTDFKLILKTIRAIFTGRGAY